MARGLLISLVVVRAGLLRKRVVAAALVLAITTLGVYALLRSRSARDAARVAEIATASRPRTDAPFAPPAPVIGAPRKDKAVAPSASADPLGADHVAALRRGLASDDEATRIAAVEAAVSATAVDTLSDLEKFELARDPETAPTVIHAVALLGASAEGQDRERAAGTLERWLRDEQRRDGPDVAGNVSNIVEALGDLGGHQAVDALSAALDRAEIPLHVQTLAVQKLGELGDTRGHAPVERFAKRVAAMPPSEGIDEELRVEAIEAARATLSRI